MTKDEVLKLALEALVLNNAEWKALADSGDSGFWEAEEQDHYKQTEQAITAIKEALAQPEQEPVAWETFALKFANGKGLSYEKPKNLPKYLACRPLIYAPVPTSDTSEKRVDETAKQRHEPEPVIDKSAAIRIATSLGWEPKRKPLTDEQWQVIADTLGCFITRTQKDAIEAVIGIKE